MLDYFLLLLELVLEFLYLLKLVLVLIEAAAAIHQIDYSINSTLDY